MAKKAKKSISENLTPKGFFRIQITEDGKGVVGDSGWQENTVTNEGVRQYLAEALGGGAALSVSHAALGTGGAPNPADTTLSGEVQARAGVSYSVLSSKTVQFIAQFVSSNSFVTTTQAIQNVGLFNAATAGILFAGNTYASSQCYTNQDVNVTYEIRFV